MASEETHQTVDELPDFTLDSTHGMINLKQLTHTNKILVFYPADNSPVCSSQLSIYNQALPIFDRYNAKIIALSTDSKESHIKFSKKLNLKFPLAVISNSNGNSIAKQLKVFNESQGVTRRAIFVYNTNDQLIWKQVYPDHINPGAEGILAALDKIKN